MLKWAHHQKCTMELENFMNSGLYKVLDKTTRDTLFQAYDKSMNLDYQYALKTEKAADNFRKNIGFDEGLANEYIERMYDAAATIQTSNNSDFHQDMNDLFESVGMPTTWGKNKK